VDLVSGSGPGTPAEGALLHATADALPALRHYREEGGRLPIFAVAEGPVRMDDRIRWVREGADDLFAADTAADALARRLRSDTWRSPPSPREAVGNVGARVDRWLRASGRYLLAREHLVGEIPQAGRSRYLDTVFLRDQVLRTGDNEGPADAFGQRRGGEREVLDWPIRVLAPTVSEGQLLNIGADGVCLALPVAPSPGERLQMAVSGERAAGRLEIEVRWQRRIGRGRWQIGAFAISCALERAD
jgi:hypothetical protein